MKSSIPKGSNVISTHFSVLNAYVQVMYSAYIIHLKRSLESAMNIFVK